MALLSVNSVSKQEKGAFTVKGVSFTLAASQKIAIAGETGSGKTTLLKMIGGLLQPDAGEIMFEEKRVRGPQDQLIPGHAGIAYLSQHFELRNNYWVHEILSYANDLPQDDADTLYRVCRIDQLLNRRTDQLSGGEKQRIALARLLIGAPRLLLLDEPFSNLDAVHRSIIKMALDDINKKLGVTCMMVSHDAPDILPWADLVLVMKEGRIIQQGRPEEIYRQPADVYCAGLFGDYNLVSIPLAAALYDNGKLVNTGKKILLRPEQLLLQQDGNGLPGIVQSVQFIGAAFLVTLLVLGESIKVIATNNFLPGEAVQLTVSKDAPWYV